MDIVLKIKAQHMHSQQTLLNQANIIVCFTRSFVNTYYQ